MSSFPWSSFVPSAARIATADVDDAPALISTALVSRHAQAIDAPIIEVTALRASVLVGVFRALKQADAIGAVAVPQSVRSRSPQAGQLALRGVVAAAVAARHDCPIVVVARAREGGNDTALTDAIARDVSAGYGGIGIRAKDIAEPDVLLRASHWATEHDLGIELEIDVDEDASLLLALLDDRQVPLAAVRGAEPMDELGRAARIVDLVDIKGVDIKGAEAAVGGLRVNIDAALADLEGTDDEVEVRAWVMTSRIVRGLNAHRSAERLANALEETGQV